MLATFITPFHRNRALVKSIVGRGLVEVYVNCTLEVCERRDPKGMYKKARAGAIADFTGVSSPFEVPTTPDIIVNTGLLTEEESIVLLDNELKRYL